MVIDQRFGRGVVIQEALNEALAAVLRCSRSARTSLAPLAQPEVEVTKLEDGDLIEFTAEVDVRPEFELPDLTTLTRLRSTRSTCRTAWSTSSSDLLRTGSAPGRPLSAPAADGDVVTISLVATQDGEPLADATAEGLEYTVGSGQMLDGSGRGRHRPVGRRVRELHARRWSAAR